MALGVLTLGISFLEGITSVHKAGGCVMLALELQVQLGSLAESVPSSWKRQEQPSFSGCI